MEILIYKKRTYKDLLFNKQSSYSIDDIISLFSSLLFCTSTSTTNPSQSYIDLYNQLLLQDATAFETIITKLSLIISTLFDQLSKDLVLLPNAEAKISHLFTELTRIDSISSNLRQMALTSTSRFNPSLLTKINSVINFKPILSSFQSKEAKLFKDITSYIFSIKDQRGKLIEHMSIIEKIFSKQRFAELIDLLSIDIITRYTNEVASIDITECTQLLAFFQEYSRRIEEDVYYLRLLFGEQEANVFNVKLLHIVFMKKLSDEFLKDESFLSKLLEEKDYSTLKVILNLVRKKVTVAKDFSKVFFDFYYKQFLKERQFPSSSSIKEGQIYLKYLLRKIDTIMKVFSSIFLNERIYQAKYKEILSKMTNCKEIKNIQLLIVIYINLHINSEDVVKAQAIYSPALLSLLNNLNDKEILFSYLEKFLIKRITTFNVKVDREKAFLAYLKLHSEIRHVMKYERMIRDINENSDLSLGNEKIHFYLFSFDGINVNDLAQVVNTNNADLLTIAKCYSVKYPHRQVMISQTLSSALIAFNKKHEIVVNYIQAELLLLFNDKTRQGWTYEEAKNAIVSDSKHVSLFRKCIYALIEFKVLKTSGDEKELINTDMLAPNNDYNEAKLVFCFEKVNQPLKKSSSITEENLNVNNMDNFEVILLQNKIPILDCAIMRLLKLANPEVVPESDLVRAIGTNEHIKKLIEEQEINLFIKKRIDALSEKGFVEMKVIDNKINYCYFNS